MLILRRLLTIALAFMLLGSITFSCQSSKTNSRILKAEYPGGDEGMIQYVINNFQYPVSAVEEGVEGMVYVRFIVNTKGETESVEIVKGIRKDIDQEVIRVIDSMNGWRPAENHGIPVKVRYMMPVKLKIESFQKERHK
jgi:TonB family protein